jgi:hypothetical protein
VSDDGDKWGSAMKGSRSGKGQQDRLDPQNLVIVPDQFRLT